jgi:hypothetical protein
MICAGTKVDERMPVWRALSEFFLDTTLNDDDCDRVAAILAASPYTEEQLEDILRYEVLPVCRWNLISIAGDWAAFDDEWLRMKLTPLIDRRPWYWRFIFTMEIDPWPRVKKKVAMLKAK